MAQLFHPVWLIQLYIHGLQSLIVLHLHLMPAHVILLLPCVVWLDHEKVRLTCDLLNYELLVDQSESFRTTRSSKQPDR